MIASGTGSGSSAFEYCFRGSKSFEPTVAAAVCFAAYFGYSEGD